MYLIIRRVVGSKISSLDLFNNCSVVNLRVTKGSVGSYKLYLVVERMREVTGFPYVYQAEVVEIKPLFIALKLDCVSEYLDVQLVVDQVR